MASNVSYAKRNQTQKNRTIVLFLIIPLFYLIYLAGYPVLMMLIYSFTDWKGSATPYNFVGLQNYIRIFNTAEYSVIFVTATYYLLAGLIQQVLSLFFAELLSRPLKGKNFFRGVIFFPFIMNGVAVALIFRMFFTPKGSFDILLTWLGLKDYIQLWVTNKHTVNYVLAFIYIWKNIGYSFLIYLGVLQSVPKEYYEAATIDGAGAWQQFKAITLPSIKHMIGLMATVTLINSIGVYDVPYVLTKGNNGTHTFVTLLTITAFKNNKYGQACAMAIIILVLAAVVMIIKSKLLKEERDVY